jgi:hypothetical protein
MVSPFYSVSDREDIQADTLNTIAFYVTTALRALYIKDPIALCSALDCLYCLVLTKVDEDVEKDLDELKDFLYKREEFIEDDEEAEHMSEALDMGRKVLMRMNRELDEQGLLFKIRTDLDSIVTNTGM